MAPSTINGPRPFSLDAQRFLLHPETAAAHNITPPIEVDLSPKSPTPRKDATPLMISSTSDSPKYRILKLKTKVGSFSDRKVVVGTAMARDLLDDLHFFADERFLNEDGVYPEQEIQDVTADLCQVITSNLATECDIESVSKLDGRELDSLLSKIVLAFRFVSEHQAKTCVEQLKFDKILVECLLEPLEMSSFWSLSQTDIMILIGQLHEVRAQYIARDENEGLEIVDKNIAMANRVLSMKDPLNALRRALI